MACDKRHYYRVHACTFERFRSTMETMTGPYELRFHFSSDGISYGRPPPIMSLVNPMRRYGGCNGLDYHPGPFGTGCLVISDNPSHASMSAGVRFLGVSILTFRRDPRQGARQARPLKCLLRFLRLSILSLAYTSIPMYI
jgi:hypothetical protein